MAKSRVTVTEHPGGKVVLVVGGKRGDVANTKRGELAGKSIYDLTPAEEKDLLFLIGLQLGVVDESGIIQE